MFISGFTLFGLAVFGTLTALVVCPLMLPVLLVAHPITYLINKIKKNKDPLEEQCEKVNIEKFIIATIPLIEKHLASPTTDSSNLDLGFALQIYEKSPMLYPDNTLSIDSIINLMDILKSISKQVEAFSTRLSTFSDKLQKLQEDESRKNNDR